MVQYYYNNAASTVRQKQAKTYYVGRLLDLGYSINQIIPSPTSVTHIYIGSESGLSFQAYEYRQLFIEGSRLINSKNCNHALGVIYS